MPWLTRCKCGLFTFSIDIFYLGEVTWRKCGHILCRIFYQNESVLATFIEEGKRDLQSSKSCDYSHVIHWLNVKLSTRWPDHQLIDEIRFIQENRFNEISYIPATDSKAQSTTLTKCMWNRRRVEEAGEFVYKLSLTLSRYLWVQKINIWWEIRNLNAKAKTWTHDIYIFTVGGWKTRDLKTNI